MKVKDKDIVEFIVLEWREPQWEFDHPTVVLSPIVLYSPNGESAGQMVEDICIDLCINADELEGGKELESEDVSREFKWRRWNLKTMHKVAKARLAGKDDWKTREARVTRQKVKFFEEDGELQFTVVESQTK